MNPYERLLAQIEEWDKIEGNVAKQRFGSSKGVKRWDSLREAFRTLVEVDGLLAAEEDGDILVNALWEYFIQPAKTWTGTTYSERMNKSDLSHLRTHRRLHETTPMASRKLNEAEVEMLKETLGELKQEIIDLGQNLGPTGSRFLLLVDSCLILLTDEDADPAAVRAKAEQLVGAASSVLPFIPEQRRRGFLSRVFNMVSPWTGNATSAAVGAVVADAVSDLELPPGM